MKRLTTFDISGLLGESEYTVRTVANQYVMYLPSTRIGSERFFSPDAVDVFRLIFEQLAVGVREEYIEMMLGKRFPMAEVTVTGNAVDVAFHQSRQEPAAFASRDGWRAPALTPGTGAGEPQALPVNRHDGAARPAPRVGLDAGAEELAAQVRAMRQRIDDLENQVHTIDEARPGPAPRQAEDLAPPAAPRPPVRPTAPAAPRRGFDDLAGRDSRAGD